MHYFIVAIGSLFAAVGLAAVVQRVHLLRHSIQVDGKVVDWEEEKSVVVANRGNKAYRVVVAFATSDGAVHQLKSTSTTSYMPALGSVYPVRYDQRNPANCCVATLMNFWIIPFGLLTVGMAILVLAYAAAGQGGL
jgi:hypothetical protein